MRAIPVLRTIATAVALLAPFLYVAHVWPQLPLTVPSHFDAAGHANRFSGRGFVWSVPIIALVPAGIITLTQRFPKYFNLPVAAGHGSRADMEAMAVELLAWVRLEIAVTFAYMTYQIVNPAHPGLGLWFLPLSSLLVVATLLVGAGKMGLIQSKD